MTTTDSAPPEILRW